MSSLAVLTAKVEASLPNPTPAQREILAKLKGVQTWIDEGRLRVAVLGQFKRGKSTLLNAILGTPLLPTGITPVTAIPTFIQAASSPSIRVEFDDAKERFHSREERNFPYILSRYVSEAENPNNRAKVRRVDIAVNSASLSDSVILVDTPGVSSTFVHNTRTAEAVLNDCDVGVFVLSADSPITEVELGYLDSVRSLIPKIFFVLNKVDLLDDEERPIAKAFLTKVLEDKLGPEAPKRIFGVSSKLGLLAKQRGDAPALAASGVAQLEHTLALELANEKRAIVFATARSRALSLVGELLYHSELEHKALLMPEQELKNKVADFERSASRFEAERQNLSDYLAVDRRQLLTEINGMTDQVWNEARARFKDVAGLEIEGPVDERQAREHIGKALEQYFESASRRTTEKARSELVARLTSHQTKAAGLISHVRQTAADLMEISVDLPPPDQAFELGREPYWVAPAREFNSRRIGARFCPHDAATDARKATAPSHCGGHGEGGAAKRRQPRLGASPECRGRLPSIRGFTRAAAFPGARGNATGNADSVTKALREVRRGGCLGSPIGTIDGNADPRPERSEDRGHTLT
jgi:GTP-binding protein EngB required for normal cell division